jgi:dUTP pyrophosphatase
MSLFRRFNVDPVKGLGLSYVRPTLATAGSCGYDLYASEVVNVINSAVKVRTNTAVSLPPGHVGLIVGRSGLGSRGLLILGGVIDTDYTGELIVICCSVGGEVFSFKPGDRVAQLLILPCYAIGSDGPVRGDRGFGSSGSR